MKKVLIIGGNGYIGSSLYPVLKSNSEVDSIDLCLYGKDLGYSNKVLFDNITDVSQYDYIVLLAAHSSVNMAEYNVKNAWDNNVTKFYDLCQKITAKQVLIYASSASVYGNKPTLSSESDTGFNPINCYDLTKITNDIIANKFINEGKQIVGLRFGTLNGYSKNIRSDLMINSMFYNATRDGIIIAKNPNIHRPILGIYDCVRAIKAIIDSDTIHTGQFNINSFNSTVGKIVSSVSEILNVPIEWIDDDPPYKQYNFSISNSLFREKYNFKYKETVETILTSLINTTEEQFSRRDDDRLYNSYISKL